MKRTDRRIEALTTALTALAELGSAHEWRKAESALRDRAIACESHTELQRLCDLYCIAGAIARAVARIESPTPKEQVQ